MKNLIVLCVLFFNIASTYSQMPFHGVCPNYEAQSNFDIKKFLGKWYEIEKYCSLLELATTCQSIRLVTQKDGTTTITQSFTPRISGLRLSTTGIIHELKNNTGRLSVSYNTIPFLNSEQFYVLATDYSNYSIVSSCRNFLTRMSFRNLWIYTREKMPSPEVKGTIYAQLSKLGVSLKYLKQTEQENCPIQHDLPNYL